MITLNFPKATNDLLTNNSDIIRFEHVTKEVAFEQAIDAVNYPVHIVPAHYQLNGDFVNASGLSNSGRDKQFNLVVVDKLRNDEHQTIACVTDTYGSVPISHTYAELREELDSSDIDYEISELYVAGNGGQQQLKIIIKGLCDLDGTMDGLDMMINLTTSVDGTKLHGLHMLAYSSTGDFKMDIFGADYKLAARHTTTINTRTTQFMPTILQMIENWNDLIMPTMSLMCDEKYSQSMALALLEDIGKKSGIGTRHLDNIADLYKTDMVRTKDKTDSLYRVFTTFGQYINDEMDEKPELQEKFLSNVAKHVDKKLIKS